MELDDDKQARLEAIGEELGIPRSGNLLARYRYPIEIGKPNFHDSKAEFLLEKDVVEKLREDSIGIPRALLGRDDESSEVRGMRTRLMSVLDATARKGAKRGPFEHPLHMLQSSSVQEGISMTTVMVLVELVQALDVRIQELKSQESVFWSSKNRPPNHYARTIALRLAKAVAQATGELPTVGTARDGGHPSTQYGRALEEIFAILGIEANFRNPAKWAVAQLTEDDLRPVRNTLSASVSPFLTRIFPGMRRNPLAENPDTRKKGQDE